MAYEFGAQIHDSQIWKLPMGRVIVNQGEGHERRALFVDSVPHDGTEWIARNGYGELLDISERPLLEWEILPFCFDQTLAKNYIRAETLKVPTYHAIISQYTHGQRKTNDLFTCSRYYAIFLPSITSRSGWRVEGPWERLRTPRKSHVRGISKTKLCHNIATKHV